MAPGAFVKRGTRKGLLCGSGDHAAVYGIGEQDTEDFVDPGRYQALESGLPAAAEGGVALGRTRRTRSFSKEDPGAPGAVPGEGFCSRARNAFQDTPSA